MSASLSVTLRCDARPGATLPGCLAATTVHDSVAASPVSVKRAREVAAKRGWTRRHGPSSCAYDLCPVHAYHVPGVDFPDYRK